MADYKELLRKAIKALPENNGAARRGVYEKARAALVGQLRAIAPPLPAKDITQHRLHLEDCIRAVEQETSEAIISLKRQDDSAPGRGKPETLKAAAPVIPATPPPGAAPPATKSGKPGPSNSIADIISEAESAGKPRNAPSVAPEPMSDADDVKPEGRPFPSIVSRTDAPRPVPTRFDPARRGPTFEPRRDVNAPGNAAAAQTAQLPRMESVIRSGQATALQIAEPSGEVTPAMSAVREVDAEIVEAPSSDPQSSIDRAIAALDREARGDAPSPPPAAPAKFEFPGSVKTSPKRPLSDDTDLPFTRTGSERERGGNAVTIFLVVLAVLLVGAGGASWWAVQNQYIDLGTMFGGQTAAVSGTAVPDAAAPDTLALADGAVPGNTEPVPGSLEPVAELSTDERLTADAVEVVVPPELQTPAVETPALPSPAAEAASDVAALPPLAPPSDPAVAPLALAEATAPNEERLPAGEAVTAEGEQLVSNAEAAVDPSAMPGSQSLLLELEVAADGTKSVVPFSGEVEWSKGVDETGQPTLIGKASIPARSLGVELLIRKNSDPTLPASHLMEVTFDVAETFVGGGVASLPGVLLKDQELVGGTPLVGASARVLGNSFLYALSASAVDSAANINLLTTKKWLDLLVIYSTGKQAAITLEKDEAADALFKEVFATWAATASTQ